MGGCRPLDITASGVCISVVRQNASILCATLLAASALAAEETGLQTGTGETPSRAATDAVYLQLTAPASEGEVSVSKRLQARGPLVRALKTKRLRDFPRTLTRLFSPGAAPSKPEERRSSGDYSPWAWTAVVGWQPGQTAFADPATHEPRITLVSVSKRAK